MFAFLNVVVYRTITFFFSEAFPTENLSFISMTDLVNFFNTWLAWDKTLFFELLLTLRIKIFHLWVNRLTLFRKACLEESLFILIEKLRGSYFEVYFHFPGLIDQNLYLFELVFQMFVHHGSVDQWAIDCPSGTLRSIRTQTDNGRMSHWLVLFLLL